MTTKSNKITLTITCKLTKSKIKVSNWKSKFRKEYLPTILESPVCTKRAELMTSNLELSRSFILRQMLISFFQIKLETVRRKSVTLLTAEKRRQKEYFYLGRNNTGRWTKNCQFLNFSNLSWSLNSWKLAEIVSLSSKVLFSSSRSDWNGFFWDTGYQTLLQIAFFNFFPGFSTNFSQTFSQSLFGGFQRPSMVKSFLKSCDKTLKIK